MNKKPKNKDRKFYYSLRMREFKFCSFCRLVVKEYNRNKLLLRMLSKIQKNIAKLKNKKGQHKQKQI